MMEAIKVFGENTMEHKKLEAAAALMTMLSPNSKRYIVGECWFDYGERVAWTTIFEESELDAFSTYQALTPRQQARVLETRTAQELLREVERFLADNNGLRK